MKILLLNSFMLIISTSCVLGKILTRCELAQELKQEGILENQLSDWVCLIESESSRNSEAKGGPNWDGSYDWGLFQINDRYWCRVGYNGGVCNIDCNNLLNGDISISTQCAKKIYKIHGFHAWYGWQAKCQGNLPDLSYCNLH